jgi:hypothetical protein
MWALSAQGYNVKGPIDRGYHATDNKTRDEYRDEMLNSTVRIGRSNDPEDYGDRDRITLGDFARLSNPSLEDYGRLPPKDFYTVGQNKGVRSHAFDDYVEHIVLPDHLRREEESRRRRAEGMAPLPPASLDMENLRYGNISFDKEKEDRIESHDPQPVMVGPETPYHLYFTSQGEQQYMQQPYPLYTTDTRNMFWNWGDDASLEMQARKQQKAAADTSEALEVSI